MAGRKRQTVGATIVKWIVIIAVVLVVGKYIKNMIAPTMQDLSSMVNMKKSNLEQSLQVTFNANPNKVKQIYAWTNKEVTVDSADGIALVYFDGEQAGLHIDNRRYGMYGIAIGDPIVNVEKTITYPYNNSFIVANDESVGVSTAIHYYNEKNNDCLVVIYNDNSQRVVALTYFNDYKTVTEKLSDL